MTERQRSWPAFADLPEWHAEAACKNGPADWWFPTRGEGGYQAKRICFLSCPVRVECLDYAVTTHQKHGIWGGLNEKQRRRVRRERAA